ncbi:ATP-grasp domain-containing protein [Streptomyces spongiae]|uniref:Circularly permuted type 2 ATP-grasp protein n=1 Tax=Streptomyces spongiae TaxID=565072 RepID=A0A5N8XCA1_9ACTN|nr:hypothetical protein [Streptomyces spongiae]MPY57143.1 circularly permuted type 2 ATP-grasp protein [Streptomyces spongiae]
MGGSSSALRVPDTAWDASFPAAAAELPARFVAHDEGYRRIRPALLPLVVSPGAASAMWDTTRACLERVRDKAARILDDRSGAAIAELGYPPEEVSWLTAHPPKALDGAGAFARADFVLGPDGPRLVEINVGPTVGGIGILDRYAEVADDLLGAHGFHRTGSRAAGLPRPARAWGRALRRLAGLPPHAAQAASPRIVLAVTDEEADIPIPHDAAHYLAAEGFDATVSRTDRIRFDGPKATVDGRAVDVVYGCFTYDEIITPRYRAFVDAAVACDAAGGPTYVAPPVFTLLGNKAMLATNGGEQPGDRHTAGTHLLTRAVLPQARAERERLVLKPTVGYGGQGVVIGRDVSDDTWEERLEAALKSRPHVLQAYVEPSSIELPTPDGQSSFEVGIGCLYVDGDFGGFLARCVPSGVGGIANVHQGAVFGAAAGAPPGEDVRGGHSTGGGTRP